MAVATACSGLVVFVAAFSAWSLMPYTTPMTPERIAKYGKWAVVAGASEGLGAAWGDELATHGLNVLLMARSPNKLETVAQAIRQRHGVEVVTLVQDLMTITKQDVLDKVISDRDVGFFVFNAAYMAGGEFLTQPLEEHLKVSQLNVNTLLTMTHPIAEYMKTRGHGGMVLMGSMAGTVGTAYYPTYSSTKSFIASLSRALWYELRPHNVDVVGCIAGATTTPSYLSAAAEAGDQRSTMIEQSPEAVVTECLAACGSTGAVATGALNKLSQMLLKHWLPADQAVQFISKVTDLQTRGGQR
ncbi:unnamed protein product [Prorocentrum cordatum]|uniref:Uncharacterized protein n=1 Tax=Prorocentrum cordatum TaxID=2364126 RepID=A0ABN9WZ45_9DINO|nr:unnamed protein product [Polarella glacialis]